MKVFFVGVWVALVALGSSYAAAMWKAGAAKPSAEAEAHSEGPAPQFLKTRAISVPMLSDGPVQGYIVGAAIAAELVKQVLLQEMSYVEKQGDLQ